MTDDNKKEQNIELEDNKEKKDADILKGNLKQEVDEKTIEDKLKDT